MKEQLINRSQVGGAFKAEIYVGKTVNRGWRWDITIWSIVNLDNRQGLPIDLLGVVGRRHIGTCGVGYARTERGAWRAARKAYRDYPGVIV
jgi:hypothetical protein